MALHCRAADHQQIARAGRQQLMEESRRGDPGHFVPLRSVFAEAIDAALVAAHIELAIDAARGHAKPGHVGARQVGCLRPLLRLADRRDRRAAKSPGPDPCRRWPPACRAIRRRQAPGAGTIAREVFANRRWGCRDRRPRSDRAIRRCAARRASNRQRHRACARSRRHCATTAVPEAVRAPSTGASPDRSKRTRRSNGDLPCPWWSRCGRSCRRRDRASLGRKQARAPAAAFAWAVLPTRGRRR